MKQAFSGFTHTAKFLTELEANNNKAWFDAHKQDYFDKLMTPAQDFVEALGVKLQELSPGMQAIPKATKGSIMRIYRDVRFSKDKTPYKTNLGIVFWEGEQKKTECPGLYFHLDKDSAGLFGGQYVFSKASLAAFREAVVDNSMGAALEEALKAVHKAGAYEVIGEQYKRVPREYDPDHPRADLLRYKGLMIKTPELDMGVVASADLLDVAFKHFKAILPLHQWLVKVDQQIRR